LRNSLGSKHQKLLKDFSFNPLFSIALQQNFLQNSPAVSGQNYRAGNSFASSDVLSEPADRAPPVI
jgi:hypothetical protein